MPNGVQTLLGLAAALVLATGVVACRTVKVNKHDPVVVQVESNEWIVAEGGWDAYYHTYGLWTHLGQLEIELTTNRTVRIGLDDFGSDVSTNHVYIINASGEAAGEVIKKAIEGLK